MGVSSFTIWQLRTSYLSTIKDGIGDRLINVNNTVLNTPGFRAAGWSSASANPNTQTGAAQIKRTYSPPIPLTTAVASEYYQLGIARDANESARLGAGEDGDDDEGGMVTGKSNMDIIGRRNLRGKRTHRRDRQQNDQQKHREAEEDDSSDLSDESDDDGDSAPRLVIRYSSRQPGRQLNAHLLQRCQPDEVSEIAHTNKSRIVADTFN